jgi:hypothetical protein
MGSAMQFCSEWIRQAGYNACIIGPLQQISPSTWEDLKGWLALAILRELLSSPKCIG